LWGRKGKKALVLKDLQGKNRELEKEYTLIRGKLRRLRDGCPAKKKPEKGAAKKKKR